MTAFRKVKKGISLLLCTFLLFSVIGIPAVAEDKEEKKDIPKIEISFTVGESTLKINGKSVTVETPYVVDGTTLVPLRVITEAFGAKVTWDEKTQGITLEYKEVVIKLNIGKKTAYINSQVTELLQAPELKNSTTMVPLRFVTENFGADVSYNSQTAEITVVKENTESNSIKDYALILKRTTKDYIGDSYHKWHMPMPKEMRLRDRTFDGYYSYFVSDDGKREVMITIKDAESSDTPDTVAQKLIAIAKEYTLIESTKKVDKSHSEYYFVKYKDKEMTYEHKGYLSNGKIFYALSAVDNGATAQEKQVMSDIIEGFVLNFPTDGSVEDLSDVMSDGYRVFSENRMKFSLKVPADWIEVRLEDKENEFIFGRIQSNRLVGRIGVEIYSEQSGQTIEQWANMDRQHNIDMFNPACIIETSPVAPINVAGVSGYSYMIKMDNKKEKIIMNDIFLMKGKYRYNLTIELEESFMNSKDYYNAVLNSFKVEEIYVEDVGQLTRFEQKNDIFTTYEEKNLECKVDIPVNWNREEQNSTSVVFFDPESGRGVNIFTNENKNADPAEKVGRQLKNYMSEEKGAQILDSDDYEINNIKMYFFKYTLPNENDGNFVYTAYIAYGNGKLYSIVFTTPYIGDGKETATIFKKIVDSFKFL
ncbi:MAG: hypothetical protein BWY15_01817 [Firmicutes bacterium ADurb.Bin193]|nr:MAG: hypothetical protein BWY15_01817 [Firmicutes bacterium ADurb.Bin193]